MVQAWRRDNLTRPIFRWARSALPDISDTEREALEAGDIWWDAELFAGNPDWARLRATPQATLSADEAAFLRGPVEQLCAMLDDWRINWELGDLPGEVWAFIKRNKFFGMIIPKEYGGLGFSATAHSEVVRKVSTRSIAGAVTIMVPNSLGPGELLMQFGTDAQRQYWLPRLADGREVPCFSLTAPEAGSDAAAMTDSGVVFRRSRNDGSGQDGKQDGKLGIRLNWRKRYITLGPVATVMGLAFKLRDPERLLGGEEDLGITVALVPTNLPGVKIGRRHLPSYQAFQNGPNEGHDVVIPLENIIGGAAQAGKGWRMLMSALAAGRGISLPSLSAAGAAFALRTTSAYARVRYQFNVPIGKFEGIQRRLAHQAGTAYVLDAARRLTCAGLDEGRKLAVVSAIMKAHATDRMREVVTDAMDVHAGKAVIDGPLNYLGNLYRAIPVGITVEGANILTQNLIIFGQGAIRCHPFLLREMLALQDEDPERGLDAFDEAFWGHVWHSVKTLGRALIRNWSFAWLAPAPADAGPTRRYYRELSRYAAGFALTADLALLTLGGALKRKELLSARLGGILSELYLLSAALKRFDDEGRQQSDLPVLAWAMAEGFSNIERGFTRIFGNLPNRPVAWLLRAIVQPLGPQRGGPRDRLTLQCAELMLAPSPLRDRLTADIYLGSGNDSVALLERAFTLTVEAEPLRQKLRRDGIKDWRAVAKDGALTKAEASQLDALDKAVAAVIAVDDFPADAFARPGAAKARSGAQGGAQGEAQAGAAARPPKPAARPPRRTTKRRIS